MRGCPALVFAWVVLAACSGPEPEAPRAGPLISRSAAWLWAQQGEDGGWHSETYGLLASGQSLTPLVLEVLLDVPAWLAPRPTGGVERALGFLRAQEDEHGALGRSDPDIEDYPCYATSLGLRVWHKTKTDEPRRRRLALWLLDQQLADTNGWTASDPAYGAWGMGGARRRPPHAGALDLSMTRHVLQALAPLNARRAAVRASRSAARHFLERLRVRGEDPATTLGFFFTPTLGDKNKAGPRPGGGYEPYGTTNADGILALLAVGLAPTDAKVVGALAPLVDGHRVDRTPGPAAFVKTRWAAATVFYYRAASAEVFARLDVEQAPVGQDWRAALVRVLRTVQAKDGSFANPATSMKEDDPLIATALALRALVEVRR